MANGTAQADSAIATYRVLRELGRRSQRSYAAARSDGSIVVLHRFTRDANLDAEPVSAEETAILLRDARCLAKNWHPNIARVRHTELTGDVLDIATELVEGVTFDELLELAAARRAHPDEPILSHAVLARIFLDVLAGLSALHGLRDAINAPLSAFHGELCPANVVVGKDGVARIVSVFRPRPVRLTAQSEALGYASPETIAAESAQDSRVDTYAVGVMLWEALMERRLYDETSPSRIAQRQREEDIPTPNARLADVAMRALAFDPALRFRTAQDMAVSIRSLAGTVAQGSMVAQLVNELAGDRIRARRAELDPSGRHYRSLAPPSTQSGTHARVSAPTLDARSESRVGIRSMVVPASAPTPAAATESDEARAILPSAPDLETSYAPRPEPPRRTSTTPFAAPARPSQRPPFPEHAFPHAERSTPSSLPPASYEDDHDLPGPRESTPDDEYLAQLGAALRAAPPTSAESALDVADLVDDDDVDDNALTTAREVSVSPRSMSAMPPAMPGATLPEVPAAPSAPSFPEIDQLTAPLAATPLSMRAVQPTAPHQPSTRTPFVVDVVPEVIVSEGAGELPERRRIAPVAIAVAAALLVLSVIAIMIASRSSESTAPAAPTSAGERGPAVAPSPAVEALPQASSGAAVGAAPKASSAPPASAAPRPATHAPAKKKSVYDPSSYD